MLSQHFCFSRSPKSYLYPSNYCTLSKFVTIMVVFQACFVFWSNSRMQCTGVFHICSNSWLRVSNIIFLTILLILYPTRVFRKCASCCAFRRWHALHICGIISGTVYGWNQWYQWLQNGFCIIPHSQIVILASFQDRHLFGDCYLIWRLSSQCVLLASVSSFYAIAKPHKLSFMNNVDILILLLLRVWHSTHGTDILYLLHAG